MIPRSPQCKQEVLARSKSLGRAWNILEHWGGGSGAQYFPMPTFARAQSDSRRISMMQISILSADGRCLVEQGHSPEVWFGSVSRSVSFAGPSILSIAEALFGGSPCLRNSASRILPYSRSMAGHAPSSAVAWLQTAWLVLVLVALVAAR